MTPPRGLTAHFAGDEAGLLRIRMHLPESATEKLIRSKARLLVPGEVDPLEPEQVEGSDGEFTVTFFSSAVVNSGQLPGELQLQFDSNDGHTELIPVQDLSMSETPYREVDPDAEIPATSPLVIYPRNVIVYSVIAIFVGLVIGFLFFAGLN